MPIEIKRALRRAVPMPISFSGTSGSGKTFSALLFAAGLAGPKGCVGMIDAENGRGTLYADDPDIRAALPDGYAYCEISAPYTPAKYIEAVTAMEKEGATVCIIDSTSHEWEGEGGCCDIAETKKLRGMPNWQLAKTEHKRFVAHCLSSPMHIVFCLRAREKVKIVSGEDGKTNVVPVGIQPIAEKSFVFEQFLSLMFDEATHFATGIKVPKMLTHLFPGGRLITKADGEAVRLWNEAGAASNLDERLIKRARSAAEDGTVSYSQLFDSLTKEQRKALADTVHAENKRIALEVDRQRRNLQNEELGVGEADVEESGNGTEPPRSDDGPETVSVNSFAPEMYQSVIVPYLASRGAQTETARAEWLAKWGEGRGELLRMAMEYVKDGAKRK